MKRINIFKAGKHTSAGGQTLQFREADLQASVDAYDPAIHEAPITVGHPKDNLPAYGWISGLEFSESEGLDAIPQQVDDDFSEMVEKGRFKKVSASFYSPEAPNNPKPGVYYLRHVGFLGAQPPAVKGLKAVEFNEDEEGVVEFVDAWDTEGVAGVFRKLREFLIDKFSKDEADSVIPSYAIEELENSARRQHEQSRTSDPDPAFNEPEPGRSPKEPDMTKEELEQRQRELDERENALKAQETNFSEREQRIAEQETAKRKAGIQARVDKLVEAGKVLPAEKEKLVSFMTGLAEDGVVEFNENGETKTQAQADFIAEFLETLPKRVPTGEHSGDDKTPSIPENPQALADKALEYQEAEAEKGRHVSTTQAMNHVMSEHAAE